MRKFLDMHAPAPVVDRLQRLIESDRRTLIERGLSAEQIDDLEEYTSGPSLLAGLPWILRKFDDPHWVLVTQGFGNAWVRASADHFFKSNNVRSRLKYV